MFLGFVDLGDTMKLVDLIKNSSGVPSNTDSLPTYRIYGPSGLLSIMTGSLAKKDTASVTDASNTTPIVLTSAGHGLTTGTRVTVISVTGNTAANGTFVVTRINADTFSLDSSVGNGDYVSGGTWNVAGLYGADLVCSAGNGFAAGETYALLVSGAISSTAVAHLHTVTVT